MRKWINPNERQMKACKCGSFDIVAHETSGITHIVCRNCDEELYYLGETRDAIERWNDDK